jgi:uncharacterized repeat protein (TIGR03803 family)
VSAKEIVMPFQRLLSLRLPYTSRLGILLLLLLLGSNAFSAAPGDSGTATEAVVYKFLGGEDGGNPFTAGLVSDRSGNFYGTTAGGTFHGTGLGAVFELSPPAIPGGSWTHTVLYNFQGGDDGSQPWDGVVMDSSGNLFGTTLRGGKGTCSSLQCGTVFELSPPAVSGGAWTHTVLYEFQGGTDAGYPYGTVILGGSGNLYGVTYLGGTFGLGAVFQIQPPKVSGGTWTEKVLYSFQGGTDGDYPWAALYMDSAGSLYGTTTGGGITECKGVGCGTVFRLSPPGTSGGNWTETVLYSFASISDGWSPQAPLVADVSGNLYGTTAEGGTGLCNNGCGTVFELVRPTTTGGQWTESLLYTFQGTVGGTRDGQLPYGALYLNKKAKGRLLGTTSRGGQKCGSYVGECGTVFQLDPPTAQGGSWTEVILHAFHGTGAGDDGWDAEAGLTLGADGGLYTTTNQGGIGGYGTIVRIKP